MLLRRSAWINEKIAVPDASPPNFPERRYTYVVANSDLVVVSSQSEETSEPEEPAKLGKNSPLSAR